MEFDFEKDLSINKFRLDEECISHPTLYYRYSEACVEAKANVSKFNDRYNLVRADVNIALRDEYTSKGVKFTEALITSAIDKDERVIKAKEKLREAEETYAKLNVAVQAMEQRKSMLDNVVKLYLSGYYAQPTASGSTRENINDNVANDIRTGLNKE